MHTYLFIYSILFFIFMYLFLYLFTINLLFILFIYLFVHFLVYLFIYSFIYLFICLFISLFIYYNILVYYRDSKTDEFLMYLTKQVGKRYIYTFYYSQNPFFLPLHVFSCFSFLFLLLLISPI